MNRPKIQVIEKLAAKIQAQGKTCAEEAQKYLPEAPVEMLLIGESPPTSGSYFYIPKDPCWPQSLPGKVFRSMLDVEGKITKSIYVNCLERLRRSRFFLMDLCSYPIDAFTSPYRVEHIRAELGNFIDRFDALCKSPKIEIVFVLPTGTKRELEKKNNQDIMKKLRGNGLSRTKIVPWGDLEKTLAKKKVR